MQTRADSWLHTCVQVRRAVGVLEVNCYEVFSFIRRLGTNSCGLRGCFPAASLLSHSCVANRCVPVSASKSSIRRFVNTEKAPTRAFSWLKAATTAFTFKTLLRHYAKRALTPRSLNVK